MRIPHLSLVSLLFAVAACGSSADDAETKVVERLEAELMQQQNPGTTSCTLVQCDGLVNPHGTYDCSSGRCVCKTSSGKTGHCDSYGQNCKEYCVAVHDGVVFQR
jgi:hypothetical protein